MSKRKAENADKILGVILGLMHFGVPVTVLDIVSNSGLSESTVHRWFNRLFGKNKCADICVGQQLFTLCRHSVGSVVESKGQDWFEYELFYHRGATQAEVDELNEVAGTSYEICDVLILDNTILGHIPNEFWWNDTRSQDADLSL